MKRAIFLRHAKANPAAGGSDRERSLSAQGLADAERAGRSILAGGWTPDLALVSDARRTRETVGRVASVLSFALPTRFESGLYEATPESILALVHEAPEEADCLLVVGHNPEIGASARRLAATGPAEDLARLSNGFPTSAFAVLRFDAASWHDIAPNGVLEALVLPDPTGTAE